MPAGKASSKQHVGNTSAPALKRYLSATVRTADRIDYWVRCQVTDTPLRPAGKVATEMRLANAQTSALCASPARASARHPIRPSRPVASKLMLACDRRVWLSALGRALKAEYDALAAPLPPRLATLVKQLEAQN